MFENFYSKKIEVWIVLILAIAGIISSLLFGGAVRNYYSMGGSKLGNLGPVVESIAAFPSVVRDVIVLVMSDKHPLATQRHFKGSSGFQFNYAVGSRPDLGYVLVNRYDGDLQYSVSELWDLNNQDNVHTWHFADVDTIWEKSTLKSRFADMAVDFATKRFRNIHALLSDSGRIHTLGGGLITADVCSSLAILEGSAFYHHSLERDHQGNFWAPQYIEPKTVTIGRDLFRDDGITLISPDGDILFKKSVIQLLDDNGMGYLVYGTGKYNSRNNNDPIHLNDIQPVLQDGEFWQKGDVFLSIRNLSMVVLYRPSTNEVLWHRRGPWLHQHDVDILNDHQISIYNNNINLDSHVYGVAGVNNMLVYDFRTHRVTAPWRAGFEKLQVRTVTEGLGEVVGDEVFVEETNHGRLIQFAPDGMVSWQYINRAADGDIYLVNWSRLISRKLGDRVRSVVSQAAC